MGRSVWFLWGLLWLSTLFGVFGGVSNGRVELDGGRLFVEPEEIVAVVFATFRVNVSVADVPEPGVFSYEFRLCYDTRLLKVLDAGIPSDHWLKPINPSNFFVVENGTVNENEGFVAFAATLLGVEDDRTGKGTLTTLTFRALDVGNASLTIVDNILVNSACGLGLKYDVFGGVMEIVLPDFDADGKVGSSDLAVICEAFGSCLGDEKWNVDCDVCKDCRINILDVAVVARAFGKAIMV